MDMPVLANPMKIIAAKNKYLAFTSTINVKSASKTFDTSSAIPQTVIVNAASPFVYPASVIMSGRRDENAKSLVHTKLTPKHKFRKPRFFISEISRSSLRMVLHLQNETDYTHIYIYTHIYTHKYIYIINI